ncbi:Uncharacterized protein APZ42_024041 [Daphnia magna]|uniref:Uncharacterized protein n=1 Tax=Daphnia magna TaxID=35525 RepID=A0A164UDY6_9CRUS|nr:Uncharacterized protein APZ42_024041 [Daphnia magna]
MIRRQSQQKLTNRHCVIVTAVGCEISHIVSFHNHRKRNLMDIQARE